MWNVNKEVALINDERVIQEVDCFTKPHAILLDSLQHGCYDSYTFHIALYKSYGFEHGLYENTDWSFGIHSYVARELGFVYKMHYSKDRLDLEKNIRSNLDQGRMVLLPVNIYYLYYSWAYQQYHAFHLFLITGYNKETNVYSVIDNLQNMKNPIPFFEDISGTFTNFNVTSDILYSAWEGLYYLPYSYYNNKFITMIASQNLKVSYDKVSLIRKFTQGFYKEYELDRHREIFCMQLIINYFKDITKDIALELPHFRLENIFGNKKCILSMVYELLLKVLGVTEIVEVKMQISDIIKEWHKLYNILCFHLYKKDIDNITMLENIYQNILQKEKDFAVKIDNMLNLHFERNKVYQNNEEEFI